MRELERNPTHTPAPEQALAPIVVIGRGRVGGSIASAAAVAGLDVRQVGRDDLDAGCAEAEIALICVPDDEIEAACERVAAHAPRLRFVGHTSGATPLAALAAASEAGAVAFSLHPLQTVPDDRSSLAGSPAAIAGADEVALALSRSLAEALGMVPFEVSEDVRSAYHAAASIASNFLIALEESAAALLAAAGIDGPGPGPGTARAARPAHRRELGRARRRGADWTDRPRRPRPPSTAHRAALRRARARAAADVRRAGRAHAGDRGGRACTAAEPAGAPGGPR